MKILKSHYNIIWTARKKFFYFMAMFLSFAFPGVLLAGSVPLTHMPGHSGSGGFHAIPGKPSGETLSHVALPDLVVAGITFASKGKGRIEATVTIKNEGRASSKATHVSAALTRGDKSQDKHSWSVQALKAGARKELAWTFSVRPGHNTLEVSVSDALRHGNRLKRDYFLLAKPVQALSNPEGQIAKGARKVLSAQAAKMKGRLVVQKVTFDDFRARKPDHTWVAITLKNVGEKTTPPREFEVQIRRADGTRVWKRFRVRALRPHESTRIEGFFKMARGENTLEVLGIEGMSRRAPTTFSGASRGFTVRHTFSPRLFTEVRKNKDSLAKNAARVSNGKAEKSEMPNENALKVFSREKHITLPKPVKTSTYGGGMTSFLEPQPHAVLQPNQHCFIRWVWDNQQPDADTRLELHLKSVTNPKHFPELILARGLDPSTRSYPWDIGNIPAGHLYTLLLYETNTDTASLLASTEIKIDTPHFGVVRKTAIPNSLFVNHKITLYADVVNAGGAVSQPIYAKVRVTGPKNFVLESRSIKIAALAHGKSGRIHFSFKPPFPGNYKAVYELDITHKYIPATEASPEINRTFHFTVQGLPDLKVLINKVPDGVLAIDTMYFHIKVINLGTVSSLPTKVYFDLTDQDREVYDVPSLKPGALWKHDFSKEWQTWSGGTGRKRYAVTVDPEHRIEEVSERNNRISDRFHIYRAGQPMPKHTPVPPRLVVTDVCGLPTSPVPPGTPLSFLVRFKCVSPDRVLFGNKCISQLRIMIDNIIFYENYIPLNLSPLYPGETYEYYSPASDADLYKMGTNSAGTHVFKIAINVPKGKHCSSGQWQTLYEHPIVVQENGNQEHAVQNALASKNPRPFPGNADKSIKPLTILSPAKNKIWAAHKTYQVAWAGEAAGPFTVTLIPKDHPNAPVQVAENVTTYATDYTVSGQFEDGLYRVKVQSENGWGISDFFTITSNSKPNLTFKAVSLTNKQSGNPTNPYEIEARFIVENKGGFETQPFNVSMVLEKAGTHVQVGHAGVLLDPMLDNRTATGRIPIRIPEGGVYTVTLYVDTYGKVDESNEHDNVMASKRYRVKPYPDLRLACRQTGQKLTFTVKNTGDGISGATSIRIKLKLHNASGFSPPGWHRDGEYLVAPPVSVKSVGPGKTLEVDGPPFALFHIHSGDTYVATVNPNRNFEELCLDNNTVAGALSANTSSRVFPDWWKTAFGVEAHCQNDTTVNRSDAQAHPWISLHFGFVIWNKSHFNVTPSDPPVLAILRVSQRGRDKTFTYDLPPLFSITRSSRRDEYRIEKNLSFVTSEGDVSYTLFLKNGPHGHELVPLTSGKIKLTVTDDTCEAR